MNKYPVQITLPLILLSLGFLSACQLGNESSRPPTGSLSVKIGGGKLVEAGNSERTLLPSSTGIIAYKFSATGPSGQTITPDEPSGDGAFFLDTVPPGFWEINLQGLNSQSEVIAQGTSRVQVEAGKTKNVQVFIAPSGTQKGILRFNLTWPSSIAVTSVKLLFSGLEQTLAPEGSTTVLEVELTPGSYPVAVEWWIGSYKARTEMYAVQIFPGQQSTKTITLSNIQDFSTKLALNGWAETVKNQNLWNGLNYDEGGYSSARVFHKGHLYIAGGSKDHELKEPLDTFRWTTIEDTGHIQDPITGPNLPLPLINPQLIAYGNRLYLFGGDRGSLVTANRYNNKVCYSVLGEDGTPGPWQDAGADLLVTTAHGRSCIWEYKNPLAGDGVYIYFVSMHETAWIALDPVTGALVTDSYGIPKPWNRNKTDSPPIFATTFNGATNPIDAVFVVNIDPTHNVLYTIWKKANLTDGIKYAFINSTGSIQPWIDGPEYQYKYMMRAADNRSDLSKNYVFYKSGTDGNVHLTLMTPDKNSGTLGAPIFTEISSPFLTKRNWPWSDPFPDVNYIYKGRLWWFDLTGPNRTLSCGINSDNSLETLMSLDVAPHASTLTVTAWGNGFLYSFDRTTNKLYWAKPMGTGGLSPWNIQPNISAVPAKVAAGNGYLYFFSNSNVKFAKVDETGAVSGVLTDTTPPNAPDNQQIMTTLALNESSIIFYKNRIYIIMQAEIYNVGKYTLIRSAPVNADGSISTWREDIFDTTYVRTENSYQVTGADAFIPFIWKGKLMVAGASLREIYTNVDGVPTGISERLGTGTELGVFDGQTTSFTYSHAATTDIGVYLFANPYVVALELEDTGNLVRKTMAGRKTIPIIAYGSETVEPINFFISGPWLYTLRSHSYPVNGTYNRPLDWAKLPE